MVAVAREGGDAVVILFLAFVQKHIGDCSEVWEVKYTHFLRLLGLKIGRS